MNNEVHTLANNRVFLSDPEVVTASLASISVTIILFPKMQFYYLATLDFFCICYDYFEGF